jgi:hypothetical protein
VKGEEMKPINVALIAAGVSAAACVGYFATLTAILVKIHNEGIEEGEEV